MKDSLLQEMLLISDSSILALYREMTEIAKIFIAPAFGIAVILEYLGEMNFSIPVFKLLIITLFIGTFYDLHTQAVDISLSSATETLRRVSPRNLFIKKWSEGQKIATKEKKNWNPINFFITPNLNDMIATLFFVLSKVFIWILKLIFSTVYHLTYIFSALTAVLYFFGWTNNAIKGTVQASFWCILMPFVIVAILCLVGNSFQENADKGDIIVSSIDSIIWLFGITLLLLFTPMITLGIVKGEGVQGAGAKMGSMVIQGATNTAGMIFSKNKISESFKPFSQNQKKNLLSKQKNNLDKNGKSKFQQKDLSKEQSNLERRIEGAVSQKENSFKQENTSQKDKNNELPNNDVSTKNNSQINMSTLNAGPSKHDGNILQSNSTLQSNQLVSKSNNNTQTRVESPSQIRTPNNKQSNQIKSTKVEQNKEKIHARAKPNTKLR